MSLIEVKNLSKSFDGEDVVKGITFELTPGKCVALLGPNGAGKTTTLRMLAGFSKPTNGTITFDEQSLSSDIRNYIGYLPQFPVFHNWMSGKEFLIYVGQLSHLSKSEADSRADELLDRVGLTDAKKQRIGKYSGGMKQRLGIAQAMMNRPKLIMLDEPVSALDPIGRREVLNLMREIKKDATILFSTHILNDAEEISDELLLLHHGELVEQGSLDELGNLYDSGKIILAFQDNIPADMEEKLNKLSHITDIEFKKQSIEFISSDVIASRAEILQLAVQNDWPLTKFEIAKTTLEDLFMKVVNQ
ncbi:ABC-2 type transport system ATP-binding protein [Salirhabdus euzebyi]|uniref:ABC-2 type transport system ATP-binding protein n=1 Tax=Salirhabdus euzebyi TaxID=394506 RepID=A0A841Q9H9_9BACI|nr:ABC transporter ATP-binding protein [Salirhabdus euzebyi]MBB6455078.1 ABC-2 type transport system ATP-binding protein [Salirhabdus euzebyi]